MNGDHAKASPFTGYPVWVEVESFHWELGVVVGRLDAGALNVRLQSGAEQVRCGCSWRVRRGV